MHISPFLLLLIHIIASYLNYLILERENKNLLVVPFTFPLLVKGRDCPSSEILASQMGQYLINLKPSLYHFKLHHTN